MRPRPRPNPDADIPSEERGKWWLETGRDMSPTTYPANPSPEYLDILAADIERAGYLILIGPAGRKLVGSGGISESIKERLRRYGDKLAERLLTTGRARIDGVPKPKPGEAVEWVDSDGVCRICTSDDLVGYDWIRWRYRNGSTWFAYTGEAWKAN